jgi:RNA-binding protein
MQQLSPEQRKFLKARGHGLKPVVMIGNAGLTEAVKLEADRALEAHELIKIRVLGDDRQAREAWFMELCEALGAAPVQHIGKLLLLYRPAKQPKLQLP